MDEEDNVDFNSIFSLVSINASSGVFNLEPAIFLGELGANSPPRDTTPSSETVDEYMKLFIEE